MKDALAISRSRSTSNQILTQEENYKPNPSSDPDDMIRIS
jgi:hypothetical protein